MVHGCIIGRLGNFSAIAKRQFRNCGTMPGIMGKCLFKGLFKFELMKNALCKRTHAMEQMVYECKIEKPECCNGNKTVENPVIVIMIWVYRQVLYSQMGDKATKQE